MDYTIFDTITMVNEKRELENKLNLLPWGSVEIRDVKGGRYIYLHRRMEGLLKTLYLGEFSDTLYQQILQNNMAAKEMKKQVRALSSQLKKSGYVEAPLSDKVQLNIDFAKRNIVDTIYKQAMLEGVAVTFLDTEAIIEGGKLHNVTANDVQKINNLKHAWKFILDECVITCPTDFNLLCLINRFVEEGFYYNAGTLRSVPVSIGGTKWRPALPLESVIREELAEILTTENVYIRAIRALLFVTKKQLFIDGNKRTSVIFANHILISEGAGLIVIPDDKVNDYKHLLIHYYETDDEGPIVMFLYNECLTKI